MTVSKSCKKIYRASLKTRIICLASPLIPLHWRGKGAFLEMPYTYYAWYLKNMLPLNKANIPFL